MGDSETAWILVEKLHPEHTLITPEMMRSGEPTPSVKSHKVWVEGEITTESETYTTIETDDESFTQESELVFEHIPENANHPREPLE